MEKFDYERPELIEFSDWNGIQGADSSGTGGEGGQPGLPSPATPGGNSLPLLPPGCFFLLSLFDRKSGRSRSPGGKHSDIHHGVGDAPLTGGGDDAGDLRFGAFSAGSYMEGRHDLLFFSGSDGERN